MYSGVEVEIEVAVVEQSMLVAAVVAAAAVG